MQRFVVIILIVLCVGFTLGNDVSGRQTKTDFNYGSYQFRVEKPQLLLEQAVEKSKKASKIRITSELRIQGKYVFTIFDHLSPNKFSLVEKINEKNNKEAIELNKQRFQKWEGEWIKTREDYFPLREQYVLFFPTKFKSLKDDIFKIKNVNVEDLGVELIDEAEMQKYKYSIDYVDMDLDDEGIVWVDKKTNLLNKLVTNGKGIAGRIKITWKYFYDIDIKIEEPKEFIEKDWVN